MPALGVPTLHALQMGRKQSLLDVIQCKGFLEVEWLEESDPNQISTLSTEYSEY